jgi:hypothetical protein
MKKFISILLALVLVLALCACGNDTNANANATGDSNANGNATGDSNANGNEQKAETIVGTWTGTVDMLKLVGDENQEMMAYFESLPLDLTLEFKEDGTYTMSGDPESLIPAMKAGMLKYMSALAGQELTEDDLKGMGVDLDQAIEEGVAEMASEMTATGTYTMDGNKFTLNNSNAEGEDNGKGSFSGNTLTFETPNGSFELTRK